MADELEQRVRAMLSARADAVTPEHDGDPSQVRRAAAARAGTMRRTAAQALTAAAAVAAIAIAPVLLRHDGDGSGPAVTPGGNPGSASATVPGRTTDPVTSPDTSPVVRPSVGRSAVPVSPSAARPTVRRSSAVRPTGRPVLPPRAGSPTRSGTASVPATLDPSRIRSSSVPGR